MNILEHIENFLGKIQATETTFNESYGHLSFLSFENNPFENINTYVTLGLSNHLLRAVDRNFKVELLCSIDKSFNATEIINAMFYVCDSLLRSHKAILRGEIIHLPESIFSEHKIRGFYASLPAFFDEEFWVYEDKSIAFIWLIPLTKKEIDYVEQYGWNKFEDLLETEDCDFWNIDRNSIIF